MNILKQLRIERGISIQRCSVETGISTRTIIRYEKGFYGQYTYLKILADYYGIPVERIANDNQEGMSPTLQHEDRV